MLYGLVGVICVRFVHLLAFLKIELGVPLEKWQGNSFFKVKLLIDLSSALLLWRFKFTLVPEVVYVLFTFGFIIVFYTFRFILKSFTIKSLILCEQSHYVLYPQTGP
jgi:hypothetical protein